MELRDYQLAAIDNVRALFVQGVRTVCLVAPTGAGKTAIALEIIRRAVLKDKRVLWLTHRTELLIQIQNQRGNNNSVLHFERMCQPQSESIQEDMLCVSTIQNLVLNQVYPRADLVIIDECHHYESDEWSQIYETYRYSKIIGLTATPQRADGRGLKNHYESLVVAIDPSRLRDRGILVPCIIYCPDALLKAGQIAQEPIVSWRTYAKDKKTIVYCRDIEHAKQVTQTFDSAYLVTSETPSFERAAIIERYKKGKINVLVNVNILTEGFDAPETECIIIARGISHASTYLQIIGRALRSAPNKTNAILLDLRGVSHVFGEPYDERIYSLDGKGIRRKDEAEDRFCPVCSAIIDDLPCEACGYDTEESKRIRILNSPLVRFARKRQETDDKRRETLTRWLMVARANGYRPGWAAYKYKATYGQWPPRNWI